jgi:cytochrome c-type biogenesis protein CcmH/NrfF
MKSLARILALCCALMLLMGADNARFDNLGGKIMCTCGCGQMLLKCNHVGCPNSEKMIRQLRTQVATTDSDEAVLQFFRDQWGVTAVVEPGRHGFELLVWVLPFAGLGLGLFLVIVIVRRWRLKPEEIKPAEVKLDPHLEALRARARQETEI